MSDATIPVGDPQITARRLDAEQLTVGAQTVVRERMQLAGAADSEIARVRATPPASTDQGLVVRPLPEPASNPQISHAAEAAVAAGASATFDSAQISSAMTGRLRHVIVAASVGWKAQLRTVQNGVASADQIVWFRGDWDGRLPHRDSVRVAHDPGAGLDAFRVVVTNLDTSQPADLYATFLYDEDA